MTSKTTLKFIYINVILGNQGLFLPNLVDTSTAVTLIHLDEFNWLKTKENKLQRTSQPILGANNKALDLR